MSFSDNYDDDLRISGANNAPYNRDTEEDRRIAREGMRRHREEAHVCDFIDDLDVRCRWTGNDDAYKWLHQWNKNVKLLRTYITPETAHQYMSVKEHFLGKVDETIDLPRPKQRLETYATPSHLFDDELDLDGFQDFIENLVAANSGDFKIPMIKWLETMASDAPPNDESRCKLAQWKRLFTKTLKLTDQEMNHALQYYYAYKGKECWNAFLDYFFPTPTKRRPITDNNLREFDLNLEKEILTIDESESDGENRNKRARKDIADETP